MKAVTLMLFFLLSLANSCNNSKNEIELTPKNHLTQNQLKTLSQRNNTINNTNTPIHTTSLDSIDIGGGDPLPPCPDSSFTDCCPTLKYLTFKDGLKGLVLELLDEDGNVIQTFTSKDLSVGKNGDLILKLGKLKASLCNGKNKLRVSSKNRKTYHVYFPKRR
ncbi:MAG: hypothetical protein ACPG6B_04335 [Oceanihabitans sp.]